MIQIITDSTADLPENLLEKYNIHVVPLTIHINGQEYKEGELTTEEFARKMAASKTLPKTSQPSPASFVRVFQKLAPQGELICITLSSKLSGTYQSACLAKKLSGVDVAIFDCLASTLAQGLYVIKAAELAEEGFSRSEIIKELEQYRDQMSVCVLLNTLEYAVKGGRLSKFQGTLTKILDIKVLLEVIEGEVIVQERVHGRKKALKRLLEKISEKLQGVQDPSSKRFSISHFLNPRDAQFLKDKIIEKFHPKDLIINEMGPTISTYAGPGGLVVSF